MYIACDLTPNLLLHNRKGKGFNEVGLSAGVAYGPDATVLSGMGIAAVDYEDRGCQSFFTTNFSAQPNGVYRCTQPGVFEDAAYQSGVGSATLNFLAWGIEGLDYDNDGWTDLIAGNGHIDPFVENTAPNTTYTQRKQLFRNQGNGMFRDQVEDLGDLAEERVTRGLAVGDFDNDGRVDILDSAHNQPARLYRNIGKAGRFVTLRLEGVKSNRDAAGALVWVTAASGQRKVAEVRLGSSYASTSDKRLHFGLGNADRVEKITVRWPSGAKQTFTGLAADTFYYLREGASPVRDPQVVKSAAALRLDALAGNAP
jgi:enediyne biosynthesis protein E4